MYVVEYVATWFCYKVKYVLVYPSFCWDSHVIEWNMDWHLTICLSNFFF